MGLFRRNRADEFQLAALQTDVARLRALADELTQRLARVETRPLPRPNPVTPEALGRVERTVNDATRAAAIARADMAVRVSSLDAVVGDLSARLSADHAALRDRLDELAKMLDAQNEYLEAHADQVATLLDRQENDPAELRRNQIRIANDLARLSIDLHDEVARLASVVTPGEKPRELPGARRNGNDASVAVTTTGDEMIDLR